MSSVRANIIRAVSGAYMQRVDVAEDHVRKIRRLWGYLGGLMITAFGVKKSNEEINGLYTEWLTPDDRLDGKVMLYLHGGGYVVGVCEMHRQLVSLIARA